MDQVLGITEDDARMAKQAVCAAFATGNLPNAWLGVEATDGPEWKTAVDTLLKALDHISRHYRST